MSAAAVSVHREADVLRALDLDAVIDAVEAVFAAQATGAATGIAKTMTTWDPASSAHALGAVDPTEHLAAFKTWVNTPAGASAVVSVFDTTDGQLLAVLEAGALGALRTAAVSGVATRWLAAPDADVLAIAGTGRQALRQVQAVHLVRPLRRVQVWSPSAGHRAAFACRVTDELGIPAAPAATVGEAVDGADVVTLVTRATEPFFTAEHLHPRVHLNAVGAILPASAEFEPALLDGAALTVVDDLANAQRASRELREHYGARGGDAWSPVRTLGEVVTGAVQRPGTGPTVFKGLGTGLADLAAATAFLRVTDPERFERR